MIDIAYKSKNFIVVNKPAGMPSQPDPSSDLDAMTSVSDMLKSIGERDELFLVHRLDRPVGGALVFARNKRAAAEISSILTTTEFKKEYLAVVEGIATGGTLVDYIYKDSAKSKAFVKIKPHGSAKYAELDYYPILTSEEHTLVRVKLKTGRFHQIRAQFSSRGMPLVGDGKYGSRDCVAKAPALFAVSLEFSCMGEDVRVTLKPDKSTYPWSEFQSVI